MDSAAEMPMPTMPKPTKMAGIRAPAPYGPALRVTITIPRGRAPSTKTKTAIQEASHDTSTKLVRSLGIEVRASRRRMVGH